jgi:lysophospholipase L1-like esterase
VPAPIRYLALGDSYTIGESVAESERFPVQLAERLRAEGIAELAPPEIIATTGWTPGELAAGIDAAGPVGPFELVTLLIGVNNQYRGRPSEEYREQFRELLRRALEFAGGRRDRVIVVSIPDWSVTPFADGRDRPRIALEIDAFNAVNRNEASLQGARYVDITPVSRLAASNPALTSSDALHPTAEMYRLWVELIVPEASDALTADAERPTARPKRLEGGSPAAFA